MRRPWNLAVAVFIAAALAFGAGARAQNVANGSQIFNSVCIACHGPASANVYGIVTTGANNPGAILAAWQSVPAMGFLVSSYNAQDRADIAAYLGTFLPPSGEIRASTAEVDFGAQPVGTPSAPRTVTIANFTGNVTVTGVSNNNAAEFPIVNDTCTGATLGANGTCRLDIGFTPGAVGPRGTTISIGNSGVVNPVALTAIGTGSTAPPPSANYQGLWWNAAESGWGINLAHQGDTIYLTWYTYDATGKASWLAMLANKDATGAYAGDILEVHGSPYNVAPYNAAAKSVAMVGTGKLSFSSPTTGTFSYTAKSVTSTKAITKLSLGGPVPTCAYSPTPNFAAATNYQGLWWNPAEDGWGMNLTHEGNSIFATWYTYDVDGSPLWLLALMTPTSPGTWSGTVQRGVGPPFGNGFDPTQVHLTDVGTATMTFGSGNSATWSFALAAGSGSKTMSRLVLGAGGTVCQ